MPGLFDIVEELQAILYICSWLHRRKQVTEGMRPPTHGQPMERVAPPKERLFSVPRSSLMGCL